MLYFTKNKQDCSGCSACYAACPLSCIIMKEDERGFLYPYADMKRCIRCGLCESVCPIYNQREKKVWEKQHASAAITKDEVVWQKSSSGGAFMEICKTFAKMNPEQTIYVYGAMFDGLEVKHIGRQMPDIEPFQKSKYIQSNLQNSFQEIKALLSQGKYVIFSGTPCQVAGLKSFLPGAGDNLFTIDLICHGVGSPKVFGRYISEKSRKKQIVSYQFRTKKKKLDYYERHRSEIKYSDGSVDSIVEDDYNQLFLNQLCLRDSCGEHCQFRTNQRWSDITIADFNGLGIVFPEIKDNRGYSTVIVNTETGETVYQQLGQRMMIYACDMKVIEKWNPIFYRTTPENKQRESFFSDFISGMSIKALRKKYTQPKKKLSYSWIKEHIPYSIKFYLKRAYRRSHIK